MKTYCSDCKHDLLDIDEPPCCDCDHTLWEPKTQPQPAPEPELLTMAQAIAKAVEMGGGEVWKEGASEHELTVTASFDIDFYQEQYHTSDGKSYTVRPLLDPYPLSFAEAWEALGRGEEVLDQDQHTLTPYITTKQGVAVPMAKLKYHKFRIVEERSKA